MANRLRPDILDSTRLALVEAAHLAREGITPDAISEATDVPLDQLPDADTDEIGIIVPMYSQRQGKPSISWKAMSRRIGGSLDKIVPAGDTGPCVPLGERAVALHGILKVLAEQHSAEAFASNITASTNWGIERGKTGDQIRQDSSAKAIELKREALRLAKQMADRYNYDYNVQLLTEDGDVIPTALPEALLLKSIVDKFFAKDTIKAKKATQHRKNIANMAQRYESTGYPFNTKTSNKKTA